MSQQDALARSNSTSTVKYALDLAGNLMSDGLRKYQYDATNRLAQVEVGMGNEASKVTYLHNAQGLRVFKSEPQIAQTAPNEEELGTDFVAWLKKNFGWLFAQAQANATLGQSFVYDDALGATPSLLGEYGNGGSKSAGRIEYLYLPTESGQAIPIGLYRGGRFYAIHTDHLGTPRLITDDTNKVVWQWSYSAFGENKPTGILRATTNPKTAITNVPVLLKATAPALKVNLRFPGQYADDESNLYYNVFRSYQASQGRYTQPDLIGLDGGLNRFGYVGGNPLWAIDPRGLISCVYHVRSGLMWCTSDNSGEVVFQEKFASGNNDQTGCKDNPDCESIKKVGPIPRGCWKWDGGWTGKPGGRTLVPLAGTQTYGRDLFRTHSCDNAFGPSTKAPFCSEGCITSSSKIISALNQLLDAEPGSQVCVVD